MSINEELFEELKNNGFPYKDADEVFKQTELQPVVVAIILKWLPKLYIESISLADHLVRSLMSATEPFDPSLLVDLFENSDLNDALKVGLGLTLSHAKTTDISEWIKQQLLDKEYRSERYALIHSLNNKVKFHTVREFMDFLKTIFDRYHNERILKLFKKYGDKDDMAFLAEKARTAEPRLARVIKKVLEGKRIRDY